MAMDIIKPSDPQFREVLDKIRNNDRYWPYLKDCIGTIVGTHKLLVIPKDREIPYIGRKNMTTQNVMAVYDLNVFHVCMGWMGRCCS